MKKFLLCLVFALFSLLLSGQEYKKNVYQDFGTWSVPYNNNTIGIHGYVTREIYMNEKEGIKFYRYELILVSKSKYNGYNTSTWLYGARVYINGDEITKSQFPDGFTMNVGIEPTLIYWYKSPVNVKINFYIKWEDAVYEPRIH